MAVKLNKKNIENYVCGTYFCMEKEEDKSIPEIQSFLQNEYEGDMDCTLVSIMTVTKYFNKTITDISKLYNDIKAIAKKFFYTDDIGTQAIFINAIANRIFKQYGVNLKSKSAYLKSIGWNFETVKKSIDKGRPLILSLWKDGRDYYLDHSVTIIGYSDIKTVDGQHHKFLEIYDNWNRELTYIDYQKLSTICSINYFV